MKIPRFLLPLFCLAPLTSAPAAVLFADNFNAPDTGNLDLSDQTGRRSGLNPAIQVRSSRVQHGIQGNALNFLNAGTGRIRFHNDLDNNTSTGETWYDWASAPTGSAILGAGGLSVQFVWNAGNTSSGNWIAMNLGHAAESAGEPGFRVNEASNDMGILFRFNGDSQIFDNGAALGVGTPVTPVLGPRNVRIDYLFNSFADGSPVSMQAWVDGTSIYSGNFSWDGNAGQIYMELETLENTSIDNLSISTVPEPSGLVLLGASCLLPALRRRRSLVA